ncbi:hypothetical protein BJ741DRAFT_709833 [Chytriomyces cf. hyalinus JEL632]|nr:hypothetical protein BJ741DRAFT_709833 [Chytriomyces cf. hyalinus JEL632]
MYDLQLLMCLVEIQNFLQDMMQAIDWTYSAVAAAMVSIGILFNLIVIVPNLWRVRNLTPSSLLIVCLCCSDSLMLSNSLSITATHLRRGDLEYSPIICQMNGFLTTFAALWSLGLCTGLTLFRYNIIIREIAVSHQYAYTYLASSAAFCALVAGLPFIFNAGDRIYVQHQTHITCTVAWFNTDTTSRAIGWICAAVLLIPVSSIGFAYIRIYCQVSEVFGAYRASFAVTGDNLSGKERGSNAFNQDSKHQESRRPSNIPITLVKATNDIDGTASADEEFQRLPKTLKRRKRSKDEVKQMALLMQSIAIVALFLIGWTPYLGMGVYEMLTGTEVHPHYEFTAEIFVSMNDLLNPVVVMIFDDSIRRNVLRGSMDSSDWTYSTTVTALTSTAIMINLINVVPNFWRVRNLTPSPLLIALAWVLRISEVSKVFGTSRDTANQSSRPQNIQRDQVSACQVEETNEENSSAGHRNPSADDESQQLPKILKRKRTKDEAKQIALLMQSIAIVGLFLIHWMPYLSMGLYENVTGTKVHLHFEFAAEIFVVINDLLNPVVVMVFDDNMRRNVLRCFARA